MNLDVLLRNDLQSELSQSECELPYTLNHEPATLNSKHETVNPKS